MVASPACIGQSTHTLDPPKLDVIEHGVPRHWIPLFRHQARDQQALSTVQLYTWVHTRLYIYIYIHTSIYTHLYTNSSKYNYIYILSAHIATEMGIEPATANRSLSTIRTELEFLCDSKLLSPEQFQSIVCQLPVSISLKYNYPPKTLQPQHPSINLTTVLATRRNPQYLHWPTLRARPQQLRQHAAARAGGAGPESSGEPTASQGEYIKRATSIYITACKAELWGRLTRHDVPAARSMGQEARGEARQRGYLRRRSDGRLGLGEFDYLSREGLQTGTETGFWMVADDRGMLIYR